MTLTFQQIVQALAAKHATDYTAAELQALAAQVAPALDVYWKHSRGDDVSADFAALKAALQLFAQNRAVRPQRLMRYAVIQYSIQNLRDLDPS